MKMFSSPTSSRISMFAPSSVPIVSAPLRASFMLPVFDDLPVTMHDVQRVQELPLVFVDALHLDVEHRQRIDEHAGEILGHARQRDLVAALHGVELIERRRIVDEVLELPQQVEVAN